MDSSCPFSHRSILSVHHHQAAETTCVLKAEHTEPWRYRPYSSIRGIIKRRAVQADDDPVKAADDFISRVCVQKPKGESTEGLFVAGGVLPVNPSQILDALSYVGVRPMFALSGSALGIVFC